MMKIGKNRVVLLSLSGGGCKGVIQAILLHHIFNLTGKQPRDLFDAFIGTSVGGILSYLYTCRQGYTTKDVIDFFTGESAKKIFDKRIFKWPINYIKHKHSSEGIEGILKEKLGEYTLTTLSNPVITTMYDTKDRQARFINSTQEIYEDIEIWKFARATSAAPTYFPPYKIGSMSLIDGGVFANDPTIYGYIEAKKMFPDKEVIVVSIGTGSYSYSIPFNKIKNWTVFNWASSLFDIVNDGQSDTTSYAIQKLLDEDRRFVFNPILPEKLDAMNTIENIPNLINLTYDYIEGEWKKEINKLISILA